MVIHLFKIIRSSRRINAIMDTKDVLENDGALSKELKRRVKKNVSAKERLSVL